MERRRNDSGVNLYEIPADPKPFHIIEMLAKLPAEMGYKENQLVEHRKRANELKIIIKGKKRALELQQSEVRIALSRIHREKVEGWLGGVQDQISSLVQSGLTKTEARDLVKFAKPEKPTKNDLDDVALTKTAAFAKQIEEYEKMLLNEEYQYEVVKVDYNMLDYNFRALQSIKGLILKDPEF